jgi:hypothetical protein
VDPRTAEALGALEEDALSEAEAIVSAETASCAPHAMRIKISNYVIAVLTWSPYFRER